MDEAFGEFRKRIVEFFPDATGEKGEPFEEPFHVGIAVSDRVDIKELRAVRVRLGELPAGLV
jgi:hypothetical protein